MKKKMSLILVCLMMLSLVGCGGSNSSNSSAMESTPAETEAVVADDDFDYPNRTIEILVPAQPGGDTDGFPRTWATYLEKYWGVPVVITNMSSNVPCFTQMHDSEPDGYTLCSCNDAMLINMVTGSLDFGRDDLTLLGIHGLYSGLVLTVPASTGWETLDDFKKACEENPDKYTLGITFSSTTRVMGEMLKEEGFQMRLVDSDGVSDRVQKMLGGHMDASLFGWLSVKDYVESGEWNALCVLDDERSPLCPDVPTAKEQGYDISYPTRHAFWMPAGVDERIVAEWDKALTELSNDPEFQNAMWESVYGTATYINPQEANKIYDDLWPKLEKYLG